MSHSAKPMHLVRIPQKISKKIIELMVFGVHLVTYTLAVGIVKKKRSTTHAELKTTISP
jgi:hypothetical protein